VYAIGRLDADSEGLLLLSDEARWNEKLLHPRHVHEREYWAQVERIPNHTALDQLERGVVVQGRRTLPCHAWMLEPQPEVVARASRPFESKLMGGSSSPRLDATPHRNEQAVRLRVATARQGRLSHYVFPRTPAIRFRKNVPDCWIGLELIEGKNRQVRRMTAAVGHPTLRLLRVRIGNFWLADLPPGQWRTLTAEDITKVRAG
jgi:23S rRNA pseudouridine2457 synthase